MVRGPRQERVREIVRKSSTCSGIAREEFREICQRCQRCLGNEEDILDLLEPLNIGNFSNVIVVRLDHVFPFDVDLQSSIFVPKRL